MPEERWLSIKRAWQQALYGPAGFYLSAVPAHHFRTSAHEGNELARVVVAHANERGAPAICDVGAGAGELLTSLAALRPDLDLLGVELRPRPEQLPLGIGWQRELPHGRTGLIVAHEWLDNIACDVVERAADRTLRIVEVEVTTGDERLGLPASGTIIDWVDRWWPLDGPGERAEVGLERERAAVALRTANPKADLLIMDFGHEAAARPRTGSMTSYRTGRQTEVRYDGTHDVMAAVAFDALAAALGGTVCSQRSAFAEAGLSAARPPLELARTDPAKYLRHLADASRVADLTATGGLGDVCWLSSPPFQDRS